VFVSAERRSDQAHGDGSDVAEGWRRALLKAAIVLVLSWVGFLLVPDRLLSFLTTRVGPNVRDSLVAGWVAGYFIALSGGFLVLQRRWKA
jgi:uncharacterized membrane protein